MRIACFRHVPFEGPGTIAHWARRRKARWIDVPLYEGRPPAPVQSYDALVVMGGPMGVYDEDRFAWLKEEKKAVAAALEADRPVLGICLGAQLIAAVAGARVLANAHREIGWWPVRRTVPAASHRLGACLPERFTPLHWHGDTFELPAGAVHLASSQACAHQAFAMGDTVLGLQFHLEATPEGTAALVTHCADELDGGPWVARAEDLAAPASVYRQANEVMDALLDALFGG